jgi:hypothetical protein
MKNKPVKRAKPAKPILVSRALPDTVPVKSGFCECHDCENGWRCSDNKVDWFYQ